MKVGGDLIGKLIDKLELCRKLCRKLIGDLAGKLVELLLGEPLDEIGMYVIRQCLEVLNEHAVLEIGRVLVEIGLREVGKPILREHIVLNDRRKCSLYKIWHALGL